MVNLLRSNKFHSVLVSYVLTSFTLATLSQPVCGIDFGNITFNDVSFAFRVEKLIEKINRYSDKGDSVKLLETMFDLKLEVEGYTGQKIDLDKQLDQVEKEIKANGGKLKKNEMQELRKIIKKKEKQCGHKAAYMATCIEYNLPYNVLEEQHLYMAKYGYDREQENKQEICIPLRVTIGVTVALCGVFLYFVPIPVCKSWAPELMKAGIALAVERTINRVEDDDKKGKDKR